MSTVSEALNGLNLSAREIASRARLPQSRVQELLDGDKASLSELRGISVGLRIPLHVLAQGRRPSEAHGVEPLFRSVRDAHEEYDVTVERIASFVDAALQLLPPRETIPTWLANLDVGQPSYPEADRLSKRFREKFFEHPEDDPAFDLPLALGKVEGVVISRLLFSRYEGVSLIAGNYCFIFVSPRFQARMLFTLGHELGHIIAHHKGSNSVRLEKPSQIGSFGQHSRDEAFVDAFSSCLLLPDVGIGKAIRAFREHYKIANKQLSDFEILLLARFYGVSFDVAARRCEDLGLLPAGVGFAISNQLRKEFGSPEKRADALGIPPRRKVSLPPISIHLASAISAAINEGNVSIGWVTDRLGLSVGEVIAANAGVTLS